MPNTLQQEVGIDLLKQIADCAETHALGQIVAVFAHREHQHLHRRIGFKNLCERLIAAHRGHIQIKQNNVGLNLLD